LHTAEMRRAVYKRQLCFLLTVCHLRCETEEFVTVRPVAVSVRLR